MSKKRIVICFSENGLVDTIIPSDLNVGKIIKALESNLNEVRRAANKKIHDIKCNEFSERVKNGIMGVPISFLDKYCFEQFEILECHEPCINIDLLKQRHDFKEFKSRQILYKGKLCQKIYHRIFIRHKTKKNALTSTKSMV